MPAWLLADCEKWACRRRPSRAPGTIPDRPGYRS